MGQAEPGRRRRAVPACRCRRPTGLPEAGARAPSRTRGRRGGALGAYARRRSRGRTIRSRTHPATEASEGEQEDPRADQGANEVAVVQRLRHGCRRDEVTRFAGFAIAQRTRGGNQLQAARIQPAQARQQHPMRATRRVKGKPRRVRHPRPPTRHPLGHVGAVLRPTLGETDLQILPMVPPNHAEHEAHRHTRREHHPHIAKCRAEHQPAKRGGQLHRVRQKRVKPGANQALRGVQRDRRAAAVQGEKLHGRKPHGAGRRQAQGCKAEHPGRSRCQHPPIAAHGVHDDRRHGEEGEAAVSHRKKRRAQCQVAVLRRPARQIECREVCSQEHQDDPRKPEPAGQEEGHEDGQHGAVQRGAGKHEQPRIGVGKRQEQHRPPKQRPTEPNVGRQAQQLQRDPAVAPNAEVDGERVSDEHQSEAVQQRKERADRPSGAPICPHYE